MLGGGVSDSKAEVSPSQVSLGGVLGSLREARTPPPSSPLLALLRRT